MHGESHLENRVRHLEQRLADLELKRRDDAWKFGEAAQQWTPSGGGGSGGIRVAKVTTEVSKATSATALGEGTVQLYNTLDLTTTPDSVDDLTGVDEHCVSINRDKKIAVNSTVGVIDFFGTWLVVVPDMCSHLLT